MQPVDWPGTHRAGGAAGAGIAGRAGGAADSGGAAGEEDVKRSRAICSYIASTAPSTSAPMRSDTQPPVERPNGFVTTPYDRTIATPPRRIVALNWMRAWAGR